MYLKTVTTHGFRAATEVPLTCELPGRFSVLLGANSGGKTTLIDSIVLAHRDVFPGTPRPSAVLLSKDVTARTIDIEYTLEDPEPSPLGMLCDSTVRVPAWTTTLTTSMGRVAATRGEAPGEGVLPVLYLSPTRNPAVDLAGREAHLIVELLRSQAYRDRNDKSLKDLRGLLGGPHRIGRVEVARARRRATSSGDVGRADRRRSRQDPVLGDDIRRRFVPRSRVRVPDGCRWRRAH